MELIARKKEGESVYLYIIKSKKKDSEVYQKCIYEVHQVGKGKAQCLSFKKTSEDTYHYIVNTAPQASPYGAVAKKASNPEEIKLAKQRKAEEAKRKRADYKKEYDRKRYLERKAKKQQLKDEQNAPNETQANAGKK